jgi:hypothetical protein
MSTASLSTKIHHVNRKFDKFLAPSVEEIPDLWHQSLTVESLTPESLRGGIARARSRFLDAVPHWQLPAFLDSLQETAI